MFFYLCLICIEGLELWHLVPCCFGPLTSVALKFLRSEILHREVLHLLCRLELFELPVSVAFKFLASGALMLNV